MVLNTVGKDTTFCPINLRYYPFDRQSCKIEFLHLARFGINISNHFVREGIVFQNAPDNANDQFLFEYGEWELVNLKLDTEPQLIIMEEVSIAYPCYTVTLGLHSKPSFYVMILMLPSILVSLISVIGFLLPSESGEKVSLQLTALLS